MNIDVLAQNIKTALSSSDNKLRAEAQMALLQNCDMNSTQFFLKCSQILRNEKCDHQIRQFSGTVASRLINMKSPRNIFYWDQVHPESKETIKRNITEVLIDPKQEIMKAGAIILATIASIELPRGQWQQIVEILVKNCSYEDDKIRIASITSLGFICEQIKKLQQKINPRLQQEILSAIIYGTRQSIPEIYKTSIKALQNALPFLQITMKTQNYRNAVFDVFTEYFKSEIQVECTYQALFEFVKVASPFLGQYYKILRDLTEVHLERRDEISILNLELWQTIGSEYAEKQEKLKERIGQNKIQQNFLLSIYEDVSPFIMKCMLIMKPQEQKNEELRNSASKALQAFVKVGDKRIVDSITAAINNTINSENPYHQQATVPLFTTICDYPDKDLIMEYFANGFDFLYGLLMIQNKLVVKNSLIGFIKLAEFLPEVFLQHKNLQNIIDTIFNFVRTDHTQIRYIAIQILANITEGIQDCSKSASICENPNILLTKAVQHFTQNILIYHQEQSEMNEKLVVIIMNIVMTMNKRDVIIQLIEFMIDEYYKISNHKVKNFHFLMQQILGLLHTAILALKNSIPHNQLLAKLLDLLSNHIQKVGVEAEGLSILGAITTTFNRSFETRAMAYWPYIQEGLMQVEDLPKFKAAISCVGDYSRMMESSFYQYGQQVMFQLLEWIQSNIDRSLKLVIISCMGDLILSMQQYGECFLEQLLKICEICFQAAYQMTYNDNDLEYAEELKATVIELYSCITFAMNSSIRPNKKLVKHFNSLATFIVRTCDQNIHPTVEYLKNCLYLLFDCAAFYSNEPEQRQILSNVINSSEVQTLVRLIQKFNDRPDIRELLHFIEAKRNS